MEYMQSNSSRENGKENAESTPGGDPIVRHRRRRDFEGAAGDSQLSEAIEKHIQRHLIESHDDESIQDPGADYMVFHELVPDLVHIDLHVLPPGGERPFPMIVTSGMSELPMQTPAGLEDYRHAELILTLPDDWPLTQEAWSADPDELHYWPIRWLKQLARLPQEYDTFLMPGHTIPNGDPPEPMGAGTRFCGWMLGLPNLVPDDFSRLDLPDGRTIYFYSVIPLYPEEIEYKIENGAEAMLERFQSERILYDVLLLNRKSAIQ